MIQQCFKVLVLTVLQAACAFAATDVYASSSDVDRFPEWRAAAARTLAARGDTNSLATAAALTFVGPPTRSKADFAKAAAAAEELASQAGELAPNNSAISWLRLQLCTNVPSCDIRNTATNMRWVDADNGAAWLPTLAVAQRDKDTFEVDRVLDDMAAGGHFNLYVNRATVLMFDALKRSRGSLPTGYLDSDVSRLTEAIGLANAVVLPAFSPLINACREAAGRERRDHCLRLSQTMQQADAVMAQLVGFAIAKRLTTDGRELRMIAERRHLLEWRVAQANQSDTPLLPWLQNARARARLAKMRKLLSEEDVCIAVLRQHDLPLTPP